MRPVLKSTVSAIRFTIDASVGVPISRGVDKTGGNQAGAPWAQLPLLTDFAPGFSHSLFVPLHL